MNNKRLLYYPVVVYSMLLLIVWFLSWAIGIVGLATGEVEGVRSLVSAEGLRWAVRAALPAVDAAPWGSIMFFVVSCGMIYGSGVVKSLGKLLRGTPLSHNERIAWLLAFVILLVCVLFVFLCVLSPWNILLGVTGDIAASPLVQGFFMLIFVVLFAVTSVFGFIYGNFRSFIDVSRVVCGAFSFFAPAFLAVLPAMGFVSCMDFTGLTAILLPCDATFVAEVLCFAPFVYILIFYSFTTKRNE